MREHCTICHSAQPSHPGFAAAPLGIEIDSESALDAMATRVHQVTVVTRSMPLANATGMTEAQRELVDRWYNDLIDDPEGNEFLNRRTRTEGTANEAGGK